VDANQRPSCYMNRILGDCQTLSHRVLGVGIKRGCRIWRRPEGGLRSGQEDHVDMWRGEGATLVSRIQLLPDTAVTTGMLGWRVGEGDYSRLMLTAGFGPCERVCGFTSSPGDTQV
jgi:hypothetical protein